MASVVYTDMALNKVNLMESHMFYSDVLSNNEKFD